MVNLSEFKSLSDIDLTARGGGADAMIVIDKAFEGISELRRDLGSFEKNTLQSTLGNINSENLNSGRTRSMLQDTDSASEMAELTQSQIQLSISQSMIAQSHQKSKNVMKLIHSWIQLLRATSLKAGRSSMFRISILQSRKKEQQFKNRIHRCQESELNI